MGRREFLQLADTYNPDKHSIGGHYISEKLDGMRCFWDGGLSRGVKTALVPWANIVDPKTGMRKEKIAPVATGLWSRYGNPIQAPDWFLNQLPCCFLDGELWCGRGNFQLTMSICRGDSPDPRFDRVAYAVYSSPSPRSMFAAGEIKNANMHRQIDDDLIEEWVASRADKLPDFQYVRVGGTFDDELMFLRTSIETQSDHCFLHQQTKLPNDEAEARAFLGLHLDRVLAAGGEGVVLRDRWAMWTAKRHKGILKYKPFHDAEATLVGFVAGREGKQGQLLGKIGALVVRTPGGVEFEIGTGFTMQDRLAFGDVAAWCAKHPGERLPGWATASGHFRAGDTITYRYRELTNDGVPREARYWRKRGAE